MQFVQLQRNLLVICHVKAQNDRYSMGQKLHVYKHLLCGDYARHLNQSKIWLMSEGLDQLSFFLSFEHWNYRGH